VKDEHVKCVAEERSESGEVLRSFKLDRPVHHPLLDVSALRFCDSSNSASELGCYDLNGMKGGGKGDRVTFEGHVLIDGEGEGEEDDDDDEDGRIPVPKSVDGVMLMSTERQNFAASEEVLEIGMCGGPVLSSSGYVVGMVEGIVPEGASPGDELMGAAAYVGVEGIRGLLELVDEKEKEGWEKKKIVPGVRVL